MTWAPKECRLPTEERPLRTAELDEIAPTPEGLLRLEVRVPPDRTALLGALAARAALAAASDGPA
jgi:hypothetical protein